MAVIRDIALFLLDVLKAAGHVLWFVTSPLHNPAGIIVVAVVIGLPLAFHFVSPWHPLGRKGHITKDRAQILNRRLTCRLRPDHGHASLTELWLYWGHWAMFRRSKRLRPAIPSWRRRLASARQYAVRIGSAQYWYRCWVTISENILLIAPPQFLKTVWLATIIMRYPGAVLSTSSKPDVFRWTSGLRARRGPVATFAPQASIGVVSTIAWNLILDCHDVTTAIRRADAFSGTVKLKGVENASFWEGQARSFMRAFFHAAGLVRGDMRLVTHWIGTDNTDVPRMILLASGAAQMADDLSGLTGAADKAIHAIRMVMKQSVNFMTDPVLAAAVLPADGEGFDPRKFLLDGGTLYMIADTHDENAPLAPLFACLGNEMHFAAISEAKTCTAGRIDPPFLMALDEITQICPVPVNVWLADSGSQGVQIVVVAHGKAQLAERWDDNGAQVIFDTCSVKVVMPGITDKDFLGMIRAAIGESVYYLPGHDSTGLHDVMTDNMLRRLPEGRPMVIRRNRPPVIVKIPVYWRDREYKHAARHDRAIATLIPAAVRELGSDLMTEIAAYQAATGDQPAIEPVAAFPPGVSVPWDVPEDQAAQDASRPWQRQAKRK